MSGPQMSIVHWCIHTYTSLVQFCKIIDWYSVLLEILIINRLFMLFSSHEVTTQTCARTQPCGQKKKRDGSNFDQNKDLPFVSNCSPFS